MKKAPWMGLWLSAFAAVTLTSCKGSDDVCVFAGDGVCDEPVNCALGTDEEDCVAACDAGEDLHLFGAACAWRDPPEEPVDAGDSSGGTLHLTGIRDSTLEVPSGELDGSTVERHYQLYAPASYDPSVTHPLVIVMPGHRGDHYYLVNHTELWRSADENDFLLVLLEQEYRWSGERRWAWWTDWNWNWDADENPDLELITSLIDRVGGEYNVDLSRVYLAGHSRGGAMAFIGALELSDVIAGACIQSGFTEFDYMEWRLESWDGRKVPMVFVHGADDSDVPVDRADAMVERIEELGWVEGEDYLYYRPDDVGHRWQPWLNQQWWDFLHDRPLGED